jgi:hypothetical protein
VYKLVLEKVSIALHFSSLAGLIASRAHQNTHNTHTHTHTHTYAHTRTHLLPSLQYSIIFLSLSSHFFFVCCRMLTYALNAQEVPQTSFGSELRPAPIQIYEFFFD